MPKLTIDGIEIEVEHGMSILQAAELAGAEIPRFCYHDRLSIAGNCRMCLVDVEKSPKPVASCAMPVGDGMVVNTKSEKAVKARNGVMELLLINHPLDCPICDQGGECDLQDQAMAFGYDRGRFVDNKRAVTDKYMGPLVATRMTRCIHCTRCIRFAEEVAGVPEIGALGRGEEMEVTTYLESSIKSELSGNVVDLCPVGALTNKPYEFTARPWELTKTETVDVLDAVGSNIRVDSRGRRVMRILPRLNESINEEWLGDKSRNACDGLAYQRLDRPYIRSGGRLIESTWNEALTFISSKLKQLDGSKIAALAGDLVDCESMLLLKNLMEKLGSKNFDCRQDSAFINFSSRSSYLFNTTIDGIDKTDAILLIGTNPRVEAPIINARILKRSRNASLSIGVIGEAFDLTYDYDHLSVAPDLILEIEKGDHRFFETLNNAERPMIILGMGALTHKDGKNILASASRISEKTGMITNDWNGFNVLHTSAARVGGLELGFVPPHGGMNTKQILDSAVLGDIEAVYLLGADELDISKLEDTFIIYQGHHGDSGASVADVILPGVAYTEKSATYVNTEGRVQLTNRAVASPGDSREDWKIIRALSDALGCSLPYNNISDIRNQMSKLNQNFSNLNNLNIADWMSIDSRGDISSLPFSYPIKNYYQSDVISRASRTMAQCTKEFFDNVQDEVSSS